LAKELAYSRFNKAFEDEKSYAYIEAKKKLLNGEVTTDF
jgi:hypothetical protein